MDPSWKYGQSDFHLFLRFRRSDAATLCRYLARVGVDSGLFTALDEVLGLKLESRRAPIPVLVIEHIEQLDEN